MREYAEAYFDECMKLKVDAKRYAEAYFDECMKLKAEIERLWALVRHHDDERAKDVRRDTIEECARVAASFHAFEVADAIRALKDKP